MRTYCMSVFFVISLFKSSVVKFSLSSLFKCFKIKVTNSTIVYAWSSKLNCQPRWSIWFFTFHFHKKFIKYLCHKRDEFKKSVMEVQWLENFTPLCHAWFCFIFIESTCRGQGGNHCSFEPFFAYEVTYGSATTFFVCEVWNHAVQI